MGKIMPAAKIKKTFETQLLLSAINRTHYAKTERAPIVSLKNQDAILKASLMDTPLGQMIAIASDDALYYLKFIDCEDSEQDMSRFQQRTQCLIVPGKTEPIESIESELTTWFSQRLNTFKTPLCLLGSPFQNSAWEALRDIPYGETQSYVEQATAIGKPFACRAVANAYKANPLAIVIPCHRIIHRNGSIGGYNGGQDRKRWLIHHEKNLVTG